MNQKMGSQCRGRERAGGASDTWELKERRKGTHAKPDDLGEESVDMA